MDDHKQYSRACSGCARACVCVCLCARMSGCACLCGHCKQMRAPGPLWDLDPHSYHSTPSVLTIRPPQNPGAINISTPAYAAYDNEDEFIAADWGGE